MSWEDREMEWPQYVLDRSLELAHRLAEDPHIGFGTGLIAQPEGDHLVLVGQGGQWLLSQDDLRPPFVSKGSLEVYSRDLLSAPLRTLEDVLRQCYDRFVWDPCGQTSPDPDCKEAPLKADQQKEADKYPDKHAKTSSYISFYPVYPHLYIYIDTFIYIYWHCDPFISGNVPRSRPQKMLARRFGLYSDGEKQVPSSSVDYTCI